jgi:TolB-like protein/Tfp pilus assembly protein PilF
LSLFNELKRRNVFKVGVAYVVIAWLVAQVLQLVFESFGTPDWVMKTVLVLLATGLPFVLFFAWAFEITPDGIKRESEVDRSQSITTETGRKLNNAIITVLVLALGYFAVDKFALSPARDAALVEAAKQEVQQQEAVRESATTDTQPDKSIAVLPFVNMSGDAENEYFSDGLTEELLNALARVKELKVTGRTSSFAFKGKNTDLREIGQMLGVAHILEGSVRKANDRVRITAQLIKAEDGYHLWSETFDRQLDDIFAIQEEIATRVAGELSATLLGDSEDRLVHTDTTNTQAYEAYLRGRYLFLRDPDDVQLQNEAEQLFQHAIELDPNFTLAWYGQFGVLNYRHRAGSIDFKEGAIQMRTLADKLIEMDPDLPESHLAMARASIVEMNWQEVESATKQALQLSPGDIDALNTMSGLMGLLDRKDDALKYALEAQARDPLNLSSLNNVAIAYRGLGQCEEVAAEMQRALSLVPKASRYHGMLANCWMLHHGETEKAIGLFTNEPLDFIRLTGLAIAYDKLGDRARAQQYLDQLVASDGDDASYQYAQIYAQWGETEKALDALDRAWEIGDPGTIIVNVDSHMDPLRDQPRFVSLMEKWWDPSKR